MISAKIIADSINPTGVRITSWELEYPRFLHSEFMTHRVFSRNAASTRARPFPSQLSDVRSNPAHPVLWTSEEGKAGMQGGMNLSYEQQIIAKECSNTARHTAIIQADWAFQNGVHRSIIGRWIEPWSHIKIVATATNHENFFSLRCHSAALPEFQVLAWKMLDLYLKSNPAQKEWGEWHMPYCELMPPDLTIEQQLKVATARACWVSYNRPDKTEFALEDAYKRHDEGIKLKHFSPFEHCAQAAHWLYPISNFDTCGMRSGWGQYRKALENECGNGENTDLQLILANKPDWIEL